MKSVERIPIPDDFHCDRLQRGGYCDDRNNDLDSITDLHRNDCRVVNGLRCEYWETRWAKIRS